MLHRERSSDRRHATISLREFHVTTIADTPYIENDLVTTASRYTVGGRVL